MTKATEQALKWVTKELNKCQRERDGVSKMQHPTTYTFLCGRISGLIDVKEKLSPPKPAKKKKQVLPKDDFASGDYGQDKKGGN